MHWKTKKCEWLSLLWHLLNCGGLEQNTYYLQEMSIMIPQDFPKGACSHLLGWLLPRKQEFLAISKTFENKVGLILRPRNPEDQDGSTLDQRRGGHRMNGVLAHFMLGPRGLQAYVAIISPSPKGITEFDIPSTYNNSHTGSRRMR